MPLDQVEKLPPLEGPYELLELRDSQSLTLRVESFRLGRIQITPRDGRPAHDVPCLRVTVPVADKPTLPRHWDITSKHLIAGLLGFLESPGGLRNVYKLTKRGEGPSSRHTLEVIPPA